MPTITDTFKSWIVSSSIVEPMLNGYLSAMAESTILSPDFEENPIDLEVDNSVPKTISGRVTSFYCMLRDRRSWLFDQLKAIVEGNEHAFTWNDIGTYLYYNSYGHGVGFWDRVELEEKDLGKKLDEFVGQYFNYVGSAELYIGDDQKIYLH